MVQRALSRHSKLFITLLPAVQFVTDTGGNQSMGKVTSRFFICLFG